MQITRKGFLKSIAAAAAATSLGGLTQALAVAQEKSGVAPRQARIADVEVFPYAIQETEIEKIALGTEEVAENILLRLRTNDGVTGWGESSPYAPVMAETQATDLAMAKHLTSIIRGRDPFTIPKIISDMDAFAPGNPGIKAAFEIALWDICGKLAGRPICCMLGNYRDSFPTDTTIFLDTPSAMAEKAKLLVSRGFKAIKVKVGEAPELDIERMQSVRTAVGKDIALRIDANQGWTPSGAIHALRGMQSLGIEFCEQPLPYWDWDGLKYVRDHSPMPIMVDESVHSPHDAITAVRMQACDMINIKLMKSGGISNGMRIAQIADAADMTCMLGCMSETRVALTAAAHVIAASRNIVYADLDSFLFLQTDPVIGGMEFHNGTIRVPDKPGLGLDIDADFLKSLRAA